MSRQFPRFSAGPGTPPSSGDWPQRKEEIHSSLRGRAFYQMRNGSREFMSTLANYKIPLAVASTRPRKVIEEAIEAVGMRSFFHAVVATEVVYRGKPDPEMFLNPVKYM